MTDTMDDRLNRLTDVLRGAAEQQAGDADPAHEDFYAWGWALSEVLARLDYIGRTLARQVDGYGTRRVLRDDEGGDPAARQAEAVAHLDEMRAALGAAESAARRYHSAVGHIAVAVDPEAGP